jgi:6-phospho-3-hexuloisomerase
MNENDVFICCSNSGSTKSVLNILEIFKNKANGTIISFVGNEYSPMADAANITVKFKTCNGGLNSADDPSKINSIQPMTTLTEQAMFVLFDLIVMMIIERLNINIKDTKQYHSNIE